MFCWARAACWRPADAAAWGPVASQGAPGSDHEVVLQARLRSQYLTFLSPFCMCQEKAHSERRKLSPGRCVRTPPPSIVLGYRDWQKQTHGVIHIYLMEMWRPVALDNFLQLPFMRKSVCIPVASLPTLGTPGFWCFSGLYRCMGDVPENLTKLPFKHIIEGGSPTQDDPNHSATKNPTVKAIMGRHYIHSFNTASNTCNTFSKIFKGS